MNRMRGSDIPDNERTQIARLLRIVRPKLTSIFSLLYLLLQYPTKSSIRVGLTSEIAKIRRFNLRMKEKVVHSVGY